MYLSINTINTLLYYSLDKIVPRSLSISTHSFIDLILTEQMFFTQDKPEQKFGVIVGNKITGQ